MAVDLKKRLSSCSDYELDIRLHVLHFRLLTEQINEEDIRENLGNLKKLDFKKLSYYKSTDRHKFILYFQHTRNIIHKYVIDIRDSEKKIRVISVHKIHADSQRKFDKYAHR